MSRRMTPRIAIGAMVIALMFGACERVGERISAPTSPNASVVVAGKKSYTLIEGVPPTDSTSVSQLIGLTGGTLSLAGHSLTVPAGVVTEPTLFTMTLGTRGYVEVSLTATRVVFGNLIDVGSGGFGNGKTVTLSLTYSWATNVDKPNKLLNVRELAGDQVEALKSKVDKAAQVVTSELEHLSGYAMAGD